MPAAYAEEDVAYREYFQPCDPSSVLIEFGVVTSGVVTSNASITLETTSPGISLVDTWDNEISLF